jgi:hypothetical protein
MNCLTQNFSEGASLDKADGIKLKIRNCFSLIQDVAASEERVKPQ